MPHEASEVGLAGQTLEIAANGEPISFADGSGQSLGNARVVEVVQQARIDQLDLMRVEMRGRAAEGCEVEALGKLLQ